MAEDENNVKALFRRGKARAELGQTDAAREDFLKVRKFAPKDKAIAKELRLWLNMTRLFIRSRRSSIRESLGRHPHQNQRELIGS